MKTTYRWEYTGIETRPSGCSHSHGTIDGAKRCMTRMAAIDCPAVVVTAEGHRIYGTDTDHVIDRKDY